MNIKNIAPLACILVTSMHAMEAPRSNTEKSLLDSEHIKIVQYLKKEHDFAWEKVINTQEYKLHKQALLGHEKHNTIDTYRLVQTSKAILGATEETKTFACLHRQLQQLSAPENHKIEIIGLPSNTENSFFDLKKKHNAFSQTPQYYAYKEAKKLHKKHNTQETFSLMEEAAALLLETQESKAFVQTVEKKQTEIDSTKKFSNNVLRKHAAMTETLEYEQFQAAKIHHEQYNTADTQYMVDLCKSELHNTKECQEWLDAAINSVKSKDWDTTPQTPCTDFSPCLLNQVDQEKIMKKLNLTTIPIVLMPKNNCINHIVLKK